jgi:hypothetical protein
MIRVPPPRRTQKAVPVAADRAHPDRAVVGLRPAHDLRLEPRQFLGMQARIHQQP